MVTIAVVNQKGGVAKTTTSVNVAVGLAMNGWRVLLIDLDPQAHSTLGVRVESQEISADQTVFSLFYASSIADIVVPTIEPNLKLVPSSIHLALAVETLNSVIFREIKLKKALEAVQNEFDYVILDCGPSLGVLSINAIVAADKILIPTQLSMYSLDGLGSLLTTIETTRPERSPNFDLRILLTMVKGHGKERQATAWKILEPLADRILTTQIRATEAVEKSQMIEDEDEMMAVVLSRQSANRGAQDYKRLVQEITERWPA